MTTRPENNLPAQGSVTLTMFYVMVVFGCIAASWEMLYLWRTGQWDIVVGLSLAVIIMSLGALLFMQRLSEETFVRLFEFAVLYLESPLLLVGVAYNLFRPEPSLAALHFASWIVVPFICAVATRPLRWARNFGWLLFGGETLIFIAWLVARGTDPTSGGIAASLVILLLSQAASLALLNILAAYRDKDLFNRARISALEESSTAMERAAEDAREAHQRMAVALASADQAMRARDRFFASMSHELRTPLNAIIGFSDILGQELFGPHTDPRYLSYAHDIKTSGDHLLGIINHLLDFARLESGEVPLENDPLELSDVVRGVVRMLAVQADEGNVSLSCACDLDCWAMADRQAMWQVVTNLVSNAIKFTPEGGHVEIAVATADDEVQLIVTDTGHGIPEARKDDIFKPFYRVENDATVAVQGTGLGLPIVQSLVTEMGGRVTVESRLGEGSTFTVTLPTAIAEAERVPAEARA